jgi:hypothetical protein
MDTKLSAEPGMPGYSKPLMEMRVSRANRRIGILVYMQGEELVKEAPGRPPGLWSSIHLAVSRSRAS